MRILNTIDLGELVVWWSIFLGCAPVMTLPQIALASLSPLFITTLIMTVSGVPILEAATDRKYGNNAEYLKYKTLTPLLVPFPRF